MAGFKVGAIYNWKIDINQDGLYAEFKGTAHKAYQVFRDLNKLCPGSKLYCNGNLVTK